MIQRIRVYPDDLEVLRTRCSPCDTSSTYITVAQQLRDTAAKHNALGLAAPQIGIVKRIIAIRREMPSECKYPGPDDYFVMANPEIISSSGISSEIEECLSLPGLQAIVWRPLSIQIKYMTPGGEQKTLQAMNLLARVVQHEIDHLDGTLIIDHIRDETVRNNVLESYIKTRSYDKIHDK